jgi:hypothetical protein
MVRYHIGLICFFWSLEARFVDKNPFGPVPWDILVFLTLTGVGFAFSVQRYVQSHDLAPSAKPVALKSIDRSPPATVELGCLDKSFLTVRRKGLERQLRLAGQFCHLSKSAMRKFGGLRVRNLTTQQESTIFFQGDDNSFLTDTLTLAEGQNQLRLEWRETPKSPVRELTAEVVTR